MPNLGDEYSPEEAHVNRIFERLRSAIVGVIMSSAEQAATGALNQLDKAKAEVDGVIAELREQSVSPATIERLEAVSQAFDDIVPDPEPTPDPEPAPEPEPEEAPEDAPEA